MFSWCRKSGCSGKLSIGPEDLCLAKELEFDFKSCESEEGEIYILQIDH